VTRSLAGYPIPWRSAPWVVHPFGVWEDPADDGRAKQWARDTRADMRPWSSGAVYLNFIGDEGEARVVQGSAPRITRVSLSSKRSTTRRTCSI
jgi:hypothetical protein